MTISLLPRSTTGLLESSVNITTPQDLVKELLDNAIDAEATSVDITLSSDTVEKIQVRDNGVGISFEDFEALGKRAHTSKIKSFHDLMTKAGGTLGFRGEALAAANSMAKLTITSRTRGDPIRTRLLLKFGIGGVQERHPVSAAVGTTVQATQLFENVPIRRLWTVRQSQKQIDGIKNLLKTYALARPYLKLCLRIVKIPGNLTVAWSYSPSAPPMLKEAILQLFGRNAVTGSIRIDSTTFSEDTDVQMVAWMPRPDYGQPSSKPISYFISVDNRPVTPNRGTGKRLTSIFRRYVYESLADERDNRTTAKPFVQLSIHCAPGMYDPNVSPAKDEVLFCNEDIILRKFEDVCRKAYQKSTKLPGIASEARSIEANHHLPMVDCSSRLLRDQDLISNTLALPSNSKEYILCQPNKVPQRDLDGRSRRSLANDPSHSLERLDFQSESRPNAYKSLTVEHRVSQDSSTDTLSSRVDAEFEKQPPLVSASLRTRIRVDLSRKDSNKTDDGAIADTVEVQIPRPDMPLRLFPSPKPQGSRSRNIEHYFQQQRCHDFEIAVDDTATAGPPSPHNVIGPRDSASHVSPSGNPLRQLEVSTVNRLQNEDELSDESNSEPEILQPPTDIRGDLDVPYQRRGLTIAGRDVGIVGRGGSGRTFSSVRAMRPRANPQLSPRLEMDAHGLQTPPSSNPVENQLKNDGPTSSGVSRLDVLAISESVQASTLRAAGPSYSTGASQLLSVPSAGFRIPRLAQTFEALHGETHTPRGALNWQSSQCRDLMMPPRLSGNDIREKPTPAVEAGSWVGRREPFRGAGEACEVGDPLSWRKFLDEDPRTYFIRARSQRHPGRRPQRLLSINLPLERVPFDDQIQRVLIKANLHLHQLRRFAQDLVNFDSSDEFGAEQSSLRFRDMSEVHLLEDELRRVVGSWTRANEVELEVDFTLAASAKGKHKADSAS